MSDPTYEQLQQRCAALLAVVKKALPLFEDEAEHMRQNRDDATVPRLRRAYQGLADRYKADAQEADALIIECEGRAE